MKPRSPRASLLGRCLLGTLLALGHSAATADDPPKPEQSDKSDKSDKSDPSEKSEKPEKPEPTPAEKEEPKEEKAEKKEAPTPAEMFEGGSEARSNWIEFSTGAMLHSGDRTQAEERHRLGDGAFGGIEDLHYTRNLNKTTVLTLDGRAILDLRDYGLSLGVVNEKLGYVRMGYRQFRTWTDGDGGYYGPSDTWFPLANDALGLDRGEFTFESGLTKEKLPKITFKYTHRFREGQKASTSWGLTHPDFTATTRGLSPSLYNIDEQTDLFELDVSKKIKATDVGIGLRYETARADNARLITQWPKEAVERKITDRQENTSDTFRTHAYTETWINKNLFLSSGFLFAHIDSDYSGNRIYGNDFDVGYAPNALNGLGYTGLDGDSQNREYLMTVNLLATPRKNLTIVPSLRVRKEVWEADTLANRTTGITPATFASGTTDGGLLDVSERLDISYSGVTNFVFYARAESTQGDGNLNETGALEQIAPIQRRTEDQRNFHKLSAGTRWYPSRNLTLDLGAYYKHNRYDYDHTFDTTPNTTASANRYPAFLVLREFDTYDANLRLTFRPWRTVTLITRYEFQQSTINTTPDALSGLASVESSEMTSHIVSANLSWVPWSRLYLQGGIDWVTSETLTPASAYTQAVLQGQNNYWTLNANAGFVVDDKTDLNVGWFYYLADNYNPGSGVALPLGAAAEEYGLSARLSRRLSDQLRLSLKYGYFRYDDTFSGGHRDSRAHLIHTSLQYRF